MLLRLGRRIRQERLLLGFSQKDFAKLREQTDWSWPVKDVRLYGINKYVFASYLDADAHTNRRWSLPQYNAGAEAARYKPHKNKVNT